VTLLLNLGDFSGTKKGIQFPVVGTSWNEIEES
jgi:hypothetical protein